MKRKLAKLGLVLGVFVYLIVLLVRNVEVQKKANDSLEALESSVKAEGRERVKLQKEVERAKTDEFIEEQARDTLNMVKEGETVLIMPENLPKIVEDQE